VSALINGRLVPVKSNTWKSRLYVSYMKEGSSFYVPTTVFTDASGEEIDRVSGYLGPAEFAERIGSVLAGYAG
jgi:hypothetical protein